MSYVRKKRPVALSIGILACNEESSIASMLGSLLRQSVFARIAERNADCEILVMANACTDRTAAIARQIFARMAREHEWANRWRGSVIEIPEPGRNNAWNHFVHEFSAVEARFLISLHADVLLHHRDALFSLVTALERRPEASVASGERCDDILFKERKTFWERLALASSPAAGSRAGEINGELVCLRAAVARRIHLPPGLGEGFDHFLSQAVGTDFFSSRFEPRRLAFPREAAHICPARIPPRELIDCRKRRMIGRTAAHVLLDYLRGRSRSERSDLVGTLRSHEAADRRWLEQLVAVHVRRRRCFVNLFPGVLRRRRNTLPFWARLAQIPEAAAGFVLTVMAGLRAHRLLRARSAVPCAQRPAERMLAVARGEMP